MAAEFAMVKLRHTRVSVIRKKYGLRGQILATIHQALNAYLSVCQLGITLASLGLGWIGEPAFGHLFTIIFYFLGITSPQLLKIVAFFTAFLLLSFLHIVIGELMPKSLAIQQSEKISIWTAVPLYIFYWLMFPAIWLLNNCADLFLKLTGINANHPDQQFYSTDEIKLILTASHSHGELSKEETDIIEHTLDFADLKATEIMRPCEEMVMLDITQPLPVLLDIASQHQFSRYPVYQGNKKNIIGIVHIKDLFTLLYQCRSDITPNKLNVLKLIRPILKVSYHSLALTLLHQFRQGMGHFAILYRSKENPVGFVTLDNLLHVLIGRITDEFHKTQEDWITNPDGSFTISGDCSLYILEQALEKEIDHSDIDEKITTVTGLILHHLGRLPEQNERIDFPAFTAMIRDIQGTRIKRIDIYGNMQRNTTKHID